MVDAEMKAMGKKCIRPWTGALWSFLTLNSDVDITADTQVSTDPTPLSPEETTWIYSWHQAALRVIVGDRFFS